jgi:hypothetical protein
VYLTFKTFTANFICILSYIISVNYRWSCCHPSLQSCVNFYLNEIVVRFTVRSSHRFDVRNTETYYLNLSLTSTWSIWLVWFPSDDFYVTLCFFLWENIVLLNTKLLLIAKSIRLRPLLFVTSCKIWWPMVDLYINYFPTFV